MKIALIGATGFVGAALLAEALARGHEVTALARSPEKLAPRPGLAVAKADVYDAAQVAGAVQGHEAILSAFNPGWKEPRILDLFLDGFRAINEGAARAGVKRILVIGGAGSLYVAPGLQLIDTPDFPAEIKPGAEGARRALAALQAGVDLDWSFLSPPIFLAPGERTGTYRLGQDQVMMDGEKPAGISVADLAVAALDEIEHPAHNRKRFTVAAAIGG